MKHLRCRSAIRIGDLHTRCAKSIMPHDEHTGPGLVEFSYQTITWYSNDRRVFQTDEHYDAMKDDSRKETP